jgi:hypothetical protein
MSPRLFLPCCFFHIQCRKANSALWVTENTCNIWCVVTTFTYFGKYSNKSDMLFLFTYICTYVCMCMHMCIWVWNSDIHIAFKEITLCFFLSVTALKMWALKVQYLYKWLWYYPSDVINTEKRMENSDCWNYFYNSCPTMLNISVAVSKCGM